MTEMTINQPYDKVREALDGMAQVDGVSAGLSPVTFRWLTSRNVYINVGLESRGADACVVRDNINSFRVKEDDIKEVVGAIEGKLSGTKQPG